MAYALPDLGLPHAEVYYQPDWLAPAVAQMLFDRLRATTAWEQPVYTFHGQTVPMPRQVAWHSDDGRSYGYSGVRHAAQPWTAELEDLRERLMHTLGISFNHVLLNRYRDGRDSVAWHADDEPELGPAPLIASVSLGAVRRFSLKPKAGGTATTIELASGSLLLMAGLTQRHYVHQVPKTTKPVGERINLTFRQLIGR